jgi:hypothetical protein
MPEFVKGLALSRVFFDEAVKPILRETLPNLDYAAGLIGSGSEVLGFDDEMSADHHWGPRVMLFLCEKDLEQYSRVIDTAMRETLPNEFRGYSTNFSEPDPNDNNVQRLVAVENGPINHRVEIFAVRDYLLSYLNFDLENQIEPADWLTFPEQKLRSVTCGEIFEDSIGLRSVLEKFAYYPHDVWLYLLATGWNRIGQEEHLMGRAGAAGDEVGSALIASRLVRDIIRLCFLMERQYGPYPKWLGTAFRQLKCAETLAPHLEAVLRSTDWKQREQNLVPAYERVAAMHNGLGITERLPVIAGNFFGRPFMVIELIGGFSKAIRERITEPEVKRIAASSLIGSIDQISDSTDILSDPQLRPTLRKLYE